MRDFVLKCRKCLRAAWRLGGLAAVVISIGNFTAILCAGGPQSDRREVRLEAFFRAHDCPAPYHVHDYLRAADLNGIDYRILPAVSVRESTCGRHARMNNRWGWDSARSGFESVARGIHYIAHELAQGRYYRGKTLDQKLHAYNPNPGYVHEVKQLMNQIDGD